MSDREILGVSAIDSLYNDANRYELRHYRKYSCEVYICFREAIEKPSSCSGSNRYSKSIYLVNSGTTQPQS